MEKEHILLLTIFSFLLKLITGSHNDCRPASCGPQEPKVRFPFRIPNRQPANCGFPGFDLSCDEQNRTIIQLPLNHSYIVNKISYASQVIYIDPEFCRPNRIFSVNITDTPFNYSTLWMKSYTFYNCPFNYSGNIYPGVAFTCPSSGNSTVISVPTDSFPPVHVPSICKLIKTIQVPVLSSSDIKESSELLWFTPSCGSCERDGNVCGLNDDGHITCVSSSREISRNVRYGLSIGLGVPAMICIIGLVYYWSSRVQGYNDTNNQSINLSSVALVPQPASRTGLDGPTIESYPKTLVGESCEDGNCAICLSNYKSKESLRTIPACSHYFHTECIDEWLKLNATCPVCRNTPESLAIVTPSSSASLSSTVVDSA